jgi:hypothetical protein
MPFQKLKEIEHKHGDLHLVIPALVNKHSQIEAGRQLGISSAAISRWLKVNGYCRKIIYVRDEKQERAE